MAESTGNPEATGYNTNGTVDRGLMQVNSIHADLVGGDLARLYDPATNIKIAYSLSKGGQDWTPWSVYNNGNYRRFL
jgi:soluble lytic murein transglycosylase-like protein